MTVNSEIRLAPVINRVERFINEGEVAGAGLAVAKGHDTVIEWYGGHARPGQPAGPTTLWPLACISKVYTATVVMMLVERGELTLSLPVHRLLPAFTSGGREKVRLRHLLTHTSGLVRSTRERNAELLGRRAPLTEHLTQAYTDPLLFEPGTAFNYTDHGYAVAGQLAEAATGRPLFDLLQTLLLKPSDLHDTFLPPPGDVEHRIARVAGVPADGTDGAMYNSRYARELAHPGLGVVATLGDLFQFVRLFAGPTQRGILSAATIRAMTTDQTGGNAVGRVLELYPPQRQPWGLGFSVRGQLGNAFDDMGSPGTFDHVGATGCIILIEPLAGITIAFVSNTFIDSDREGFVRRISAVVGTVLAALT